MKAGKCFQEHFQMLCHLYSDLIRASNQQAISLARGSDS
jgi:hypothetical protein